MGRIGVLCLAYVIIYVARRVVRRFWGGLRVLGDSSSVLHIVLHDVFRRLWGC